MDGHNASARAVLICLGIVTMLSMNMNASAEYDGEECDYTVADSLQNVEWIDVLKLNHSDLLRKAQNGERFELEFLGTTVEFNLTDNAHDGTSAMIISSEGDSERVKDMLSDTRTYIGTELKGIEMLTATMTSDWIHFCFSLQGYEYMIDAIDGTGISEYYLLYSTSHQVESNMDLSNDAIMFNQSPRTDYDVETEIITPSESVSKVLVNDTISEYECISEEGQLATTESTESVISEPGFNKTLCPDGGDPEYRVAVIMLADDKQYRDSYPDDYASRMIAELNDIDSRYEDQVGIHFNRIAIVDIPATWNGTYEYFDMDLIAKFRFYMTSDPSVSGIERDVSHLFTGKDIEDAYYGTGPLGVSYQAGVQRDTFDVNTDLAYSVSEQFHDGFMNMIIMGHELGHNFNGVHQYAGTVDYCHSWMYHEYVWPMTGQFTTNNANRIKSWASQSLDSLRVINPGPSTVSSDNLQATIIFVDSTMNSASRGVLEVGMTIAAYMTIKNLNSYGITLQLLFFGARDASNYNKDFGQVSNVYMPAGSTYSISTTWTPPSGGAWSIWPAYKYDNHYGPYKWMLIQPTIYYVKGIWAGADYTTSTHQVDLWYRFLVMSNTATISVGSTVTISAAFFNGISGNGTNTFTYFFVGCRLNTATNKDFGHSGEQILTQNCTTADPTGGGYRLLASRTIDATGNWDFWPTYLYNGAFGPYNWHRIRVSVS